MVHVFLHASVFGHPAYLTTNTPFWLIGAAAAAPARYKGEDLEALVLFADDTNATELDKTTIKMPATAIAMARSEGDSGSLVVICTDKTHITFIDVNGADEAPGSDGKASFGQATRFLLAEKQERDCAGDATLCVAPQGYLVVAFGNALELWSIRERCSLRVILHPEPNYLFSAISISRPVGPLSFLLKSTVEVYSLEGADNPSKLALCRRGALRVRTGHEEAVMAIACVTTPDNVDIIITAADDGNVKTWRTLPSGRLRYLGTVEFLAQEVNDVCILPTAAGHYGSGAAVACAVTQDGTFVLVDVHDDRPPVEVDGKRWKREKQAFVRILPLKACVVAVASDMTLHAIDLTAPPGEVIQLAPTLKLEEGWITGFFQSAVAADGQHFLISAENNIFLGSAATVRAGHVRLASLQKGCHSCEINAVTFCEKAVDMIALADCNRETWLYNTAGDELTPALRLTGQANPAVAMTVSPDGDLLAVTSFGDVRLWHVASMTCVASIPTREVQPSCLTFTGDGTSLIVGERRGRQPMRFNVQGDVKPLRLETVIDAVDGQSVLFGPHGRDALCIASSTLFYVKDVLGATVTRRVAAPGESMDPSALAVSHCLRGAVVSYSDGTVAFLQAATGVQNRAGAADADEVWSQQSDMHDMAPVAVTVVESLPFEPERLCLSISADATVATIIAVETRDSDTHESEGKELNGGHKHHHNGSSELTAENLSRTTVFRVNLNDMGEQQGSRSTTACVDLHGDHRFLAAAPDGSVIIVASLQEGQAIDPKERLEVRCTEGLSLLATLNLGEVVAADVTAATMTILPETTSTPSKLLVAAITSKHLMLWALESVHGPQAATATPLLAAVQPTWETPRKDFFEYEDVTFFFPARDSMVGPMVAIAHTKGQVRLFNASDGTTRTVFESDLTSPCISGVAGAPGFLLVRELEGNDKLAIWRVSPVGGENRIAAFVGRAVTSVDMLVLSTDSQYLYAVSEHQVQTWELARDPDARGCSAVLTPCAFGKHLLEDAQSRLAGGIHSSGDGMRLTAAIAVTAEDPLPTCNALLLINSDNQLLVGMSSGHLLVLDTPGLQVLRVLVGHHGASIDHMALSANGTVFVTASSTIRVWDTATATMQKELLSVMSNATPTCLALDASGQSLFEGTERGYVAYWDLRRRPRMLFRSLAHASSHGVTAVRIIDHGDMGISCGGDKTVRVWQLRSGSCSMVFPGVEGIVTSLAISPDERYIVAGRANSNLQVWDLHSRKAMCLLQIGPNGSDVDISSLAVATDGATIAAGTGSGDIWLVPTWGLLLGHGLPRVTADVLVSTAEIDRYLPHKRARLQALRTLLHRAPYALYQRMRSEESGGQDEAEDEEEEEETPMGDKLLQLNETMETELHPYPAHSQASSNDESEGSGHVLPTALVWAARRAERLDLLEVFLECGPPFFSVAPDASTGQDSLLREAIHGGNMLVVGIVTKAIVRAARASDAAFTSTVRTAGGPPVLELGSLTEHFTTDVIQLLAQYPEIAASFLRELGLVRALTDHGFAGYRASLGPEDTIVVGGGAPAKETLFWLSKKQNGWLKTREKAAHVPIPVDARIVPLPSAAAFVDDGKGRQTSLLQVLLQARRPDVFDNFIAKAVISFKWKTFGRRKFLLTSLLYIVQLVMMTSLIWVLPDPIRPPQYKSTRSRYWFASTIILALLAVGNFHKLIYETRQAIHTATGGRAPSVKKRNSTAKQKHHAQRQPQRWSKRLAGDNYNDGSVEGEELTSLASFGSAESLSVPSEASSENSATQAAPMPAMQAAYRKKTLAKRVLRALAEHFGDLWNILDALHIVLTFALIVSFFAGWKHTPVFLAVGVYFRWFGLLYYLQPLETTGPLVRMIVTICFDVRYFVMVLVIALVATFLALYLLVAGGDYGGIGTGLLVTYNMLFLGEFEVDALAGEYTVLVRLVFVVTTLFVTIILLNLLIAIMGDSYARIQENSEVEFLRLRATVLREYELFMSPEELADENMFPKWLHVLVPHGRGVGSSRDTEAWHGLLGTLEERLGELEDSLSLRSDRLREDTLASVAASHSRIGEVGDRLNGLERDVARLRDRYADQDSIPPTPRRVYVSPAHADQGRDDDDGFGF